MSVRFLGPVVLLMLFWCACTISTYRRIGGKNVHSHSCQCGQTRTVAGNGGAADSLYLGLGIEGSRKSTLNLDSIRMLNRTGSDGRETWERIEFITNLSTYDKCQRTQVKFAPGLGLDSCTLVIYGMLHCGTGDIEPYLDTLRIAEVELSGWLFPKPRR